jgi:aminopeptidase N
LNSETIDTIQTDIEHIYKFYNKWFGDTEVQDMCLVISKRDKGGGYSRRGGLFLGGVSDSSYLNNRIDYIRYVGHEIAHFWWYGADGNWEDWLNESFAEYSAMILIRELRGEEEFSKILNDKKNKSSSLPPIWELPRNSSFAETVLYSKGPVLLNELEGKIGSKKFLKLCKARISKNIKDTSDFLKILKDSEGQEIANWFERSLKE